MAEDSNPPQAQAPAAIVASDPPVSVPVKPDYVKDQFWNTAKNEVDVVALATTYNDLASRFAKGKETLVPEIKAEVEKQYFGKRPEKPEGYIVAQPKEGPLAERLSKGNLHILSERPGPDFKPEQGKNYYYLNKEGHTYRAAAALAHRAGLSNDEFMELAAGYAEGEFSKQKLESESFTKRLAENRKLLGEHADKRVDFVKGKVNALVGESGVNALGLNDLTAQGIEALEKILEAGGQSKFAPESAGTGVGGVDKAALQKEADDLIVSRDYGYNRAKNDRVTAIYQILSPGKRPGGGASAGSMRK